MILKVAVAAICVAPNPQGLDPTFRPWPRSSLFITQLINGMVLHVDAAHNH